MRKAAEQNEGSARSDAHGFWRRSDVDILSKDLRERAKARFASLRKNDAARQRIARLSGRRKVNP
jgi:hypothetical protein